MPSASFLKNMNRVHRTIMNLSGGRAGWSLGKMPVVELTVTGRKSGQERTSLLTIPWSDGETKAIVASAGGNDQHPAWFLNLRDNPSVTVRSERGTEEMLARITSGQERDDLWSAITSRYKNYAGYQAKTDREIPVVLLEPARP